MKIIECPRDAMQGIEAFIPTEKKIKYINQLLKVGFDTIDFGSFVSPKAIPQMRDTWKIVQKLDLEDTDSKLLSIVANLRGANMACDFEEIDYLGFPFSISETFQLRNTNSTVEHSFELVQKMLELTQKHNKQLVVYISMGFGNPYGDFWDTALVEHWIDRLFYEGVEIFSVSDTVGVAQIKDITKLFNNLEYNHPTAEFGVHLHTEAHNWREKVDAAYKSGCERFDGAIKGFGGCPFAQNSLIGNMPTENLIEYFEEERADFIINKDEFHKSMLLANDVFMASVN